MTIKKIISELRRISKEDEPYLKFRDKWKYQKKEKFIRSYMMNYCGSDWWEEKTYTKKQVLKLIKDKTKK